MGFYSYAFFLGPASCLLLSISVHHLTRHALNLKLSFTTLEFKQPPPPSPPPQKKKKVKINRIGVDCVPNVLGGFPVPALEIKKYLDSHLPAEVE